MLLPFGFLVVLACVFGGFVLEGGHLGALYQPYELLMIGGAAVGTFFMANDAKAIKATFASLPTLFRSNNFAKEQYMELMAMLHDVMAKIRKEGLMSLERDIDSPADSALFSKYTVIAKDHHLMEFITDYLRLMVSGSMDAYQIENLMDNEIATHHEDGELPVHTIMRLADAMPAFGIVAAVMGVVQTMASVGKPPAELGHMIAAALVGTFLGILLAYGLITPIAALLKRKHEEAAKVYQCVKVTLLASLNGYAPQLAVEFGRKVISASERPSFIELETQLRQSKSRS